MDSQILQRIEITRTQKPSDCREAFFVPQAAKLCRKQCSPENRNTVIFFWKPSSQPDVAFSRYGLQILHRGRSVQQGKLFQNPNTVFQTNAMHRPLSPGFPASTGLARAKSSFSNLGRAPRHFGLTANRRCGGLPFGRSATNTSVVWVKCSSRAIVPMLIPIKS